MPDISEYFEGVIGAIVILIGGLALGPTVVTTVQGLNTTGWSFTGYEGAEALVSLIPLIYWAAILLVSMTMLFAIAYRSYK